MIRVLLVDDHVLVREGLKSLLQNVKGIKVIGDAKSGEEAVDISKQKSPDVVIMDVRMPGIGGLEATKKILRSNPETKIIALTVMDEEPIPSIFLQAGASGYLTKGSDLEEMLRAIKSVYAGKRYLTSEVAQQLALKHVSDDNSSPFDNLSEREVQIMLMITSGQKVQEISDKLFLSPKTINSYRYRLFSKLTVKSDVELTRLAMRHGIIDNHNIIERETSE